MNKTTLTLLWCIIVLFYTITPCFGQTAAVMPKTVKDASLASAGKTSNEATLYQKDAKERRAEKNIVSDKIKSELVEKIFSITDLDDEEIKNQSRIFLSNENLPSNFDGKSVKNINIQVLNKEELKKKFSGSGVVFFTFEEFTVKKNRVIVRILRYWMNETASDFYGETYRCTQKGKKWKCKQFGISFGMS